MAFQRFSNLRFGRIWLLVVCLLIFLTLLFRTCQNSFAPVLDQPNVTGSFPSKPDWQFDLSNTLECELMPLVNSVMVTTQDKSFFLNPNNGQVLDQLDVSMATDCPFISSDWFVYPLGKGSIKVISKDNRRIHWIDAYNKPEYLQGDVNNVAFGDTQMFVLRSNKQLTTYDLESGVVLWEVEAKKKFMNMIVAEETLIMAGDAAIFAYDINSGDVVWTYQLEDTLGEIIPESNKSFLLESYSRPDYFLEFDVIERNVNNVLVLPNINYVQDFFEKNGIIYILGDSLVAFDKEAKKIIWEFHSKDTELKCFAGSLDYIFVKDKENTIYKISIFDGRLLGTLKTQRNQSCPVVVNENLVVPFSNYLLLGYKLAR